MRLEHHAADSRIKVRKYESFRCLKMEDAIDCLGEDAVSRDETACLGAKHAWRAVASSTPLRHDGMLNSITAAAHIITGASAALGRVLCETVLAGTRGCGSVTLVLPNSACSKTNMAAGGTAS